MFYIIGVFALLWWFIDNFKSLFSILWNITKSYILPGKNRSLNEKYGEWAGNNNTIFSLIRWITELAWYTSFINFKSKYRHVPSRPIDKIYIFQFVSWMFIWECVVVTGSTDGIGKEYAKQLAQRGLNIILIARNSTKLTEVSAEIGKLCNKTKLLTIQCYWSADFQYGFMLMIVFVVSKSILFVIICRICICGADEKYCSWF